MTKLTEDGRDLAGLDYGTFDRWLATVEDPRARELAVEDHLAELDRKAEQLERLLGIFGKGAA